MWGSETAETNLRTMLFPCYLQLLAVDVGERDCGDESADDAVPMLFAAVGGRCWGALRNFREISILKLKLSALKKIEISIFWYQFFLFFEILTLSAQN